MSKLVQFVIFVFSDLLSLAIRCLSNLFLQFKISVFSGFVSGIALNVTRVSYRIVVMYL